MWVDGGFPYSAGRQQHFRAASSASLHADGSCAPVPRPDGRPAPLGNRTLSIAVMMVMRMPRVIAIVAGCVLAAGCGSGAAASGTANGTSGPGSTRPAASSVPASSASAAARCREPASLPAGAAVQAWRLGAVRFVSPDKGLALTAPGIECDVPLGDGRGTEVYVQAQPVRLAATSDAGRHWVTSGTELPGAPQSTALEQVAAVDGARAWVVTGTGKLLVTGNAGATWAAQPLPAPVVAAASAGGWLWALSCPPVTGSWCRPDVERMKLPAGTWTVTRPGSPASLLEPQLDVLSATAAVVVLRGTHPALASTTDGGARWTVRAAPAGPENMCDGDGDSRLLTTAGPRDWWLLCTGGAAAGSSTKALMRSADAGQTWTVAASVTSLSAPARPGSLARQDAVAIAAGSPEVLWLATPNTVTESTDGGVTWSQSLFNPQGTFGQFDVQSSTHAWLLAPNAGLWHTTDGTTWRPAGGPAT
jgi:hypothetical protein